MKYFAFDEFIEETIPQALFHITEKDIDPQTGARLDDIILLELLYKNKEALESMPLSWFVDYFLKGDKS